LQGEFQIALVEACWPTACASLAARSGALVGLIDTNEDGAIPLWRLLAERALCVNTTAAGGNASLMTSKRNPNSGVRSGIRRKLSRRTTLRLSLRRIPDLTPELSFAEVLNHFEGVA
jgi:hypothetical protein